MNAFILRIPVYKPGCPSFQPRLVPPLVVLNNTFGGHIYDSAIRRWMLGGVLICLNELNTPGNFGNIVHQDNGLPSTVHDFSITLYGAAVRPHSLPSISLSLHSWRLLILPISGIAFRFGPSDAKCKLSVTSSKDLFSSKDNPTKTRTRTIVGVIPWPGRRY